MQAWEITDGKRKEIVFAESGDNAMSYAMRSIWRRGEKLRTQRRPSLDHFYKGAILMERYTPEERRALDRLGWGLGPF